VMPAVGPSLRDRRLHPARLAFGSSVITMRSGDITCQAEGYAGSVFVRIFLRPLRLLVPRQSLGTSARAAVRQTETLPLRSPSWWRSYVSTRSCTRREEHESRRGALTTTPGAS